MALPTQSPEHARLVESWFPYVAVSHLVAADRRSKDPVYGVHKWFARRPPTLVRALLLASHLDDTVDEDTFWHQHSSAGRWLEGATVYDPFMGGGTSLVESARMGAAVVGRDVDPIAVAVVGSELAGPDGGFDGAADDLVLALKAKFHEYFDGSEADWTPLHWFWLARPTCPQCDDAGLLYKDLIIATSSGQRGAVARDDEMHAFCPECLTVHALKLSAKTLTCCGRRRVIRKGTYERGKYRCPSCGEASTHEALATGQAPRVLVAVEETKVGTRRRIRTATEFDRGLIDRAADGFRDVGNEFDVQLETDRRDRRPVSAGFTTTRSLFTPRQWAVFTSAFSMIRSSGFSDQLERELTLMLTGSLSSNNILCGYARDWGRLAPLFSVRGFSLPALMVELNPFHPTGGRGTFRSAKSRISERTHTTVKRARIVRSPGNIGYLDIPGVAPADEDGVQLERPDIELPVQARSIDVECRSADDPAGQSGAATVCVTDPPYFDFIAYSELSEFFRVWLRDPKLSGTPLLPNASSPIETFATGLGGALKATLGRLIEGAPLVFTYHSANPDAWTAIGDAFDIAGLKVVALWPVLADPHMGHHAAAGNCEWDVVVVARRADEVNDVSADELADRPTEWLESIEEAKISVGPGDRASFTHAWTMGKSRFGRIEKQYDEKQYD